MSWLAILGSKCAKAELADCAGLDSLAYASESTNASKRQSVKAAVSATNVPFAGLQRLQHVLSRPPQQGSYLTAADPSVRGH